MSTLHLPRLHDDSHRRLSSVAHVFWAVSGTVVVAFIFFAALGAFDPADAEGLTVAVLVLATLWVSHSWRQLWREEREP
jgi:hypothetical protein